MDNKLDLLVRAKFKHNFQIKAGPSGREYVVDCPYCDGVKGKRKMNINCQKCIAFCHREQKAYNLMTLLNTKVKKSTIIPSTTKLTTSSTSNTVPNPGECSSLLTLDKASEAIQFLTARQLDNSWTIKELSDTFKIRYCYKGRKFLGGRFDTTNTLVIPIIQDGVEIGWQSRLLYNPDTADPVTHGFKQEYNSDTKEWEYSKPPKYCTSPGLRRSATLYNIDNARKHSCVVITEGPFDAMAVGENAVAAFGKGLSDLQIRLIKYNWKKAYVLLDADAEKESKELARKLNLSIPTKFIPLTGVAKDPGDLTRLQIGALLNAYN